MKVEFKSNKRKTLANIVLISSSKEKKRNLLHKRETTT